MKKSTLYVVLLAASVLALAVASVYVGSVPIPSSAVTSILLGDTSADAGWSFIVWESRVPQCITALLCGAALAVSGLILQTVFNNPLADSSVLGISSGASLGVALVLLAGGGSIVAGQFVLSGFLSMVAGAFVGAMVVMSAVLFLSVLVRSNVMLLITGLMIGYLASSAVSLMNYVSTAEGVQAYMLWGMGNFGGVSLQQMPWFAFVALLGIGLALSLVKPLNAMLLGERYAANLGIHVRRVRNLLLVVTGLLTAVTTAFCGPVLFIDLAVPHIARLLLGTSNHRVLLPMTLLTGAVVALLCNLVCVLPGDAGFIPLNSVTPIIGAPVVIYVILSGRGRK